jgi:hypothetical protein
MHRKRLLIATAVFSPLWVPALFALVALWTNRGGVRHRLTVVHLGQVSRALEAHRRQFGAYPTSLRALPPRETRDGWDREFRYTSNGQHYALWSAGEPQLIVRDIKSPP